VSDGAAQVGARATVLLTGLGHDGEAVGRLKDGRAVFVAGGLPGELAEIVITEVKPRLARGRLAAIPEVPAEARLLVPRCPYYGTWPARGEEPDAWCGGCQLQHMAYDAQLRFKAEAVRAALSRIGRIENPPVAPTLGMADPWRYRNTLRLHAAGGQLGLIARDGRTLVPIEDCPIAHDGVADLIPALAEARLPDGCAVVIRAGTRTGDAQVVLYDAYDTIADLNVELDASVVLVDGSSEVHLVAGQADILEGVAGRGYTVPATAFFQANTAMADRLVEHVIAAVPARSRQVVDAYCGVGLFTVALAPHVGAITGIDIDAAAIAAAVDNAAGLDNVTLIEGPVAEGLAAVDGPVDAVVVDPPRAGLEPAVLELLAARAPGTIVYVSCEPSSLARDVRRLAESGYALVSCQPIDMFPQTHHVETVSVLERRA